MVEISRRNDDKQCNSCRNEAEYEIQIGKNPNSTSCVCLCKDCFKKLIEISYKEIVRML